MIYFAVGGIFAAVAAACSLILLGALIRRAVSWPPVEWLRFHLRRAPGILGAAFLPAAAAVLVRLPEAKGRTWKHRPRRRHRCRCGCGGNVPGLPIDGNPLDRYEQCRLVQVVRAYNGAPRTREGAQ